MRGLDKQAPPYVDERSWAAGVLEGALRWRSHYRNGELAALELRAAVGQRIARRLKRVLGVGMYVRGQGWVVPAAAQYDVATRLIPLLTVGGRAERCLSTVAMMRSVRRVRRSSVGMRGFNKMLAKRMRKVPVHPGAEQ